MRLSRIYINEELSIGEYKLNEQVSHYISRVLRYNVGVHLQLFNGSGFEFSAEILSITKKNVQVKIYNSFEGLPESKLNLNLLQCVSRSDRMDFTIQKTTELGVTSITPIISERCNLKFNNDQRTTKKLEHWNKIIISACEQSGRSHLPQISNPISLTDYLYLNTKIDNNELKIVLSPSSYKKIPSDKKPDKISILVGPEGGLSDNELTQAKKAGFYDYSLGSRILRTETAPISMVTIAQYLWGDLS